MPKVKKLEGDEFGTPLWFYNTLEQRFKFKLDPCTQKSNRLGVPKFFTKEDNGLDKPWHKYGATFMNPPYSKPLINQFVRKAYLESLQGIVVIGLVRQDPSTEWWNKWVRNKARVISVPFRLKFVGGDGLYNFPSVILQWDGLEETWLTEKQTFQPGRKMKW
jgi:phage N-6-adenine-methyltransferase